MCGRTERRKHWARERAGRAAADARHRVAFVRSTCFPEYTPEVISRPVSSMFRAIAPACLARVLHGKNARDPASRIPSCTSCNTYTMFLISPREPRAEDRVTRAIALAIPCTRMLCISCMIGIRERAAPPFPPCTMTVFVLHDSCLNMHIRRPPFDRRKRAWQLRSRTSHARPDRSPFAT